jgi:thiol-disulfide isomerase/thioredoxin
MEKDAHSVLFFHSPRCGPCHAVQPHVDHFVQEWDIEPIYVDTTTSEGMGMVRRWQVRSTPTLVVLAADGTEIKRTNRVPASSEAIRRWVDGD